MNTEDTLRAVCGKPRTMHRWAGVGEPGPFPVEPPPGSPEAVAQATETIGVRAEADRAWDRVLRERGRKNDLAVAFSTCEIDLRLQIGDLTRQRNEAAAALETSRLLCERLADALELAAKGLSPGAGDIHVLTAAREAVDGALHAAGRRP